ncbi:dihydrolipoyl dehydrogenase [Mesobacterium pallidum]|uniref:dihydrolipoyl dehydrogenase n=1 Tax=Mesobacterium pallidum TaxID=2872037 RepID=UPI001EE1F110|nr:dihydrolipoyl dehydrogenase [Mesobacterium pallidum]
MTATTTPSAKHTALLVIGAGPGGYAAAFRAADLGKSVTLVDRRATLGGVCLNVGCIPSKALLHAAQSVADASDASAFGVSFGKPSVDLDALRDWKDGVITRLTQGLAGLARRRKVDVLQGEAAFMSDREVTVSGPDGVHRVTFDDAIIATGSVPVTLPFLPKDPRIIDSTGALAIARVPDHLVILGGGVIGLEMAQVYQALGSRITIVEMATQIIPSADAALVKPLADRIGRRYDMRLGTTLKAAQAHKDDLQLFLSGPEGETDIRCDALLVAVGRRPDLSALAIAQAGLSPDRQGFLPVNSRMQTQVPHIYAIGDIADGPMLAHKAAHQGKTAAEAICGLRSHFDPVTIPSVAYTAPEVAWAGLTETEAKAQGIEIDISSFPWAASGRAMSMGDATGVTRLITDRASGRVLGVGITGAHAGELIAEGVLAIEMGADAADLALSVHPHPTLSETLGFAAEAREGTLTDL